MAGARLFVFFRWTTCRLAEREGRAHSKTISPWFVASICECRHHCRLGRSRCVVVAMSWDSGCRRTWHSRTGSSYWSCSICLTEHGRWIFCFGHMCGSMGGHVKKSPQPLLLQRFVCACCCFYRAGAMELGYTHCGLYYRKVFGHNGDVVATISALGTLDSMVCMGSRPLPVKFVGCILAWHSAGDQYMQL